MTGTRRTTGLHGIISGDRESHKDLGGSPGALPQMGDRNSGGDISGPHFSGVGRSQPVRQVRDPIPSFTGRSGEVERLSRMLRTATGAVATISGVRNLAGIGKTALACRVAQEAQAQFPLQIFLDMRGQSEAPLRPELALERVIRAFPQAEARLPTELEPLTELYRSLLSGQRALIIADDVRDSAQIKPLLPPPGCALLLTSRSRLMLQGVPTYHSLELDALTSSDATALLRSLCSRISMTQAAELATRCSNLPLALQLVGNMLRDDPTRQIPDFTQQLVTERARIESLRTGDNAASDLLTVISLAWKYADPWSRGALGQLTILNTGFDREMAEAVIALPPHASPVSEILRRLQKILLIEQDPKTSLFYIHNLIRGFAQNQSDPAQEQPARARHAAQVARMLQIYEQRYRQGRDGPNEALGRFDRERAHVESAYAWATERATLDETASRRCIELVLAAPNILNHRMPPRLRIRWFESGLSCARRIGDRQAEARLLGYLGPAYRELGQPQRAVECYEQSLTAARAVGERTAELRALSSLGLAFLELAQPQKAITYFEPNLALARELADRRAEGVALGNLGLAHLDLNQAARAVAYFELDLAIARSLGDLRSEGRALGNLGLAQRMNGQPQRAIEYYDQHLKIARLVGDRRGEGNSAWNRALALMAVGRRGDAITGAELALRIREENGDPRADKVRAAILSWKSAPATKPAP